MECVHELDQNRATVDDEGVKNVFSYGVTPIIPLRKAAFEGRGDEKSIKNEDRERRNQASDKKADLERSPEADRGKREVTK